MGITPEQLRAMELRLYGESGKKTPIGPPEGENRYAVSDELKLHDDIIAFCNSQSPRWKYIHARTDQKSTIAKGACDFVIFLPNGRFVCIECKSRTGKWSTDQLAWKMEMERIGHTVHECRSMQEFFAIVNHEP